jgi:DNA adenine methylase
MKRSPGKYPPHLIGFVSIGCSFGAKMWGGYARNKKGTNYAAQGARACLATKPFLSGVKFTTGSFHEMNIPDGALVYCDPPYAGTLGYGDTNTTNVGVNFWRWCNDLVARDCRVFVSGYKQNKTTDWDIIWSKDVNLSLDNNRGDANWRTARTEALFCHRSQSGIERKPEAAPEVIVDCCPQCKSTEKETTLAACETSDGYNKWHGDL